MAALDTFEWFVSSQLREGGGDLAAMIRTEREYLFSLRSEDERQRAVDAFIATVNEVAHAKIPRAAR
jgi:hypothetical protein